MAYHTIAYNRYSGAGRQPELFIGLAHVTLEQAWLYRFRVRAAGTKYERNKRNTRDRTQDTVSQSRDPGNKCYFSRPAKRKDSQRYPGSSAQLLSAAFQGT